MSICAFKMANLQLSIRAFLLANRNPGMPFVYKDAAQKSFVHNKSFRMEERRPKVSHNAEVLRAANCNVSLKNLEKQNIVKSTDETKPSKENFGGHSNNNSSDSGGNMKIFLSVAAALGLGGIAYYFMKDNSEEGADKNDKILPKSSQDLPKHVPYLLIGGGTASFSAFRAIKSNDARAKVLIITDENRNPYMRPPLSKELWYSAKDSELTRDYKFKQWTGTERSLYFEPDEFFLDPAKLTESEKGGIAVAQGFTVKQLDPTNQKVILTDGYEIGYDKCLIATGCRPKALQVFANSPPGVQDKVMVYRTPDDFERLKSFLDSRKRVAIVGNGFIGSELACALANYSKHSGARIYQIFPESGNMSKVLPDYLSKWTMKRMEMLGVCILPNSSIKSAARDDNSIKLTLSTGEIIETDIVVVCVGCTANTDLAGPSGLEVDNNLGGFVVNAELEARRNLFAAGDASCFYDPLLGRRRVEHHDHSVVSGRLAGENMVGKKKPYAHQSMFWSDLGPEIGYEGIGLVDSSLPTVAVFALPANNNEKSDNLAENVSDKEVTIEPKTDLNNTTHLSTSDSASNTSADTLNVDYGRGVLFYLKDDKIVGILLWNIFNRIGLARTIINQNHKYEDLNEVAKLFEIHS